MATCFGGKKKYCHKGLKGLAEKVRLLEEEIKVIVYEREKESREYEGDMVIFAFKEAEWKQERKRLKEEVKRLRKAVEEKEERIRELEEGLMVGEKSEKDWRIVSSSGFLLAEQIREERAWRDEAVDKWKKLYLAIKAELDDLIHRTHRDGVLYWRAEEEDLVEELKMEVKAKEQTVQELKARLATAEHEQYNKARDLDMLRQSLRIMSNKRASSFGSSKPKLAAAFLKQANYKLKS